MTHFKKKKKKTTISELVFFFFFCMAVHKYSTRSCFVFADLVLYDAKCNTWRQAFRYKENDE